MRKYLTIGKKLKKALLNQGRYYVGIDSKKSVCSWIEFMNDLKMKRKSKKGLAPHHSSGYWIWKHIIEIQSRFPGLVLISNILSHCLYNTCLVGPNFWLVEMFLICKSPKLVVFDSRSSLLSPPSPPSPSPFFSPFFPLSPLSPLSYSNLFLLTWTFLKSILEEKSKRERKWRQTLF